MGQLTPHADDNDGSALIHTDRGHFRLLPGESLTFSCDSSGKVTTKHQKAEVAGPKTAGASSGRSAALEKIFGGLRPPKMDK